MREELLKVINETIEENDGLCLDNEEERVLLSYQLLEAVVDFYLERGSNVKI